MARCTLPFVGQLIATLPVGTPGLFNPWRERCRFDTPNNGPAQRAERLAAHLNCRPEFILVGEAPGYQGCRYSGVAFTSERLLMQGSIPRIDPVPRLSSRENPFSEPSATIVWKTLYALGIAETTVLWNALQLHPHRDDTPWSNRTPSDAELALGAPALQLLVAHFPSARVVGVGKKAEALLRQCGISPAATVRHPANGGATQFADGLRTLVHALGN